MKNIKEIKLSNINPNKIGICLGIIIFIMTLFGVTYAFVEPTFYNNEVIGFSAVENTDDANKIKITDDTSLMRNFLIPIKDEDIYKAIDRENICVDDNGHYVCSLYEFTIENTWEASQKLSLSLFTESNTYGNYHFMLFKANYNNLNKDNQIVESTHLTQDLINKDYYFPNVEPLLEPGQKVTYTILFYVKAIEASQTAADRGKNYTGHINVNSISTGYSEDDEYKDIISDSSGSENKFDGIEKPDISGGLVPIKYNGSKWVVTTTKDKEWYNYEEQKWANAAILKDKDYNVVGNELILPDDSITESQSNVYAMFVWIPRFSYTIGCTSSSSCLGYKVEEASALSKSTPGAIDIKFVSVEDDLEIPDMDNGVYPNYTYSSETDRTPTNWYTHPAFWWDENGDGVRPEDNSEELSGIWVGKFETSVDSTSTCYTSMSTSSNCLASVSTVTPRILPNVISLRYQTVYNQFETAKKFSASGNIYGIDNTKTDSHMMKNSEWSAVAYLSQSIYGKYGNKDYSGANKEIYKNDSSSFYTGRSQGLAPATDSSSSAGKYKYDIDKSGTGASTTGNIYGVYDMSGGAYDRVMGNYNNTVSSSGISSSWFTTTSNIKYYDKFTTTTSFTTKNKQTIGQALYEVAGWYGDYNDTFDSTYAWLTRGGFYVNSSNAGAFNGYTSNGNANYNFGFRSVFVMTIA